MMKHPGTSAIPKIQQRRELVENLNQKAQTEHKGRTLRVNPRLPVRLENARGVAAMHSSNNNLNMKPQSLLQSLVAERLRGRQRWRQYVFWPQSRKKRWWEATWSSGTGEECSGLLTT